MTDIALGFDCLRAIGPFDVGQAVVVAGKHVLAVEAAEGTDQMLARVAEMRANGRLRAAAGSGVLVKAAKPGQDRRFDLPSIGPQTVDGVARAGLAGIAVVAGETIIAEPERVVRRPTVPIFSSSVSAPEMSMNVAPAARTGRGGLHVFFVAGEESGDRLGAALMQALKQRCGGRRSFLRRRRRADGGARDSPACFRSAIWRSSALPRSRCDCRKFCGASRRPPTRPSPRDLTCW